MLNDTPAPQTPAQPSFSLPPPNGRKLLRTVGELIEDFAKEHSGLEQLAPVRLGFGSIDHDLRGISAGQVCGIAARTTVGKTWVLNTICHEYSRRLDVAQVVFSLEMPGPEWIQRQLAVFADVSTASLEEAALDGRLSAIASPFIERMERALFGEKVFRLDELPRAIDEARGWFGPACPVRLVVVDYLGRLKSDGRDAYERGSSLARGLKDFAKREQVAVIVAMQLSRAAGDGSQEVTLEMLRDSGVLEEELDVLLGCWRPGKASGLGDEEREALKDVLSVKVLKNRKGDEGRKVDLHFRPESRRLYEMA